MNMVIDNVVVVVDVLGAGSITGQQNASLTSVSEFRVNNAIALRGQV